MHTATATRWHTITDTALLGELTLVRDGDALVGAYFRHHWYRPDRAGFGPRSEDGFGDAIGQLDEYLAGQRRVFELPLAPRGEKFQHRVWDLVAGIGYGQTSTYGALATELGGDVTAQQVGAAVGRNPLSIFIPCHRVVGRNGTLTSYAGGLARKRALLELESGSPERGLW